MSLYIMKVMGALTAVGYIAAALVRLVSGS
jgi:hypothetical protein